MGTEIKKTDQQILAELSEPFETVKWKVQTANQYGVTFVAYVDARDVSNRLNKVCGMGWKRSHEQIRNQNYCILAIWSNDLQCWVSRMDIGTQSMTEGEKGESSDSFKRAAVNFGIAKDLYDLPIIKWKKVISEKRNNKERWYPADNNGKRIYDITEFVNRMNLVNRPNQEVSNNQNRNNNSKIPKFIPEELAKELLDKCKSLGVTPGQFNSYLQKKHMIKNVVKLPFEKYNETIDDIKIISDHNKRKAAGK